MKKSRGRPKKVTESPYILELALPDRTIRSEGATPLEALTNLEKPIKIITKATLTIRKGPLSREIFMMPAKLKRFFYPLARVVTAKNLAFGLK